MLRLGGGVNVVFNNYLRPGYCYDCLTSDFHIVPDVRNVNGGGKKATVVVVRAGIIGTGKGGVVGQAREEIGRLIRNRPKELGGGGKKKGNLILCHF